LLMVIPGQAFGSEPPAASHFDSHGVTLQYTVEGEGAPVILIHGLYSSGQMNWRAPGITRELAKNYQVITLDVRGHGGSGKPAEESAYGIELVEDVVRLMDHLKIQKAHIVGYSMGGMITMKLLVRHPERMQSAVLGGMGLFRQGSPLQEIWHNMPERNVRATPPACARSLGALAVTADEVKAIHLPVSVVVGDRDPVRSLYVVPLHQLRPDWKVTMIEDAGHINCIVKPQFREAISDWLAKQNKP
jgi:pimeloyl-ACP methyl ester carboxylesterase